MEETSFLIKKIPKELWNKFKDKIPRSKSLNDALIDLIKKKVEE